MPPEIRIANIEVEIGKKKLSLTVEEAKQLKGLLNNLFGTEIHNHYQYNPHLVWGSYTPTFVRDFEVTCQSSGNMLMCKSTSQSTL